MLYNVSALLFLLVIATANTNSHQRFKSTQKPDILVDDSLFSKALDPPTHISEFTDPDTGFNPFLDLEEGPTFIGRNVMKDETRQDPPFMDFNIMEGDGSNRRWLELDVSKEPIEESIPRWVPFEEEVKLEDFNFHTTVPTQITETDQTTTSTWTTTFDNGILNSTETNKSTEQNVTKELQIPFFSNAAVIYTSVALVILVIVLLIIGSCWYRYKSRTTQSVTAIENGELKC